MMEKAMYLTPKGSKRKTRRSLVDSGAVGDDRVGGDYKEKKPPGPNTAPPPPTPATSHAPGAFYIDFSASTDESLL